MGEESWWVRGLGDISVTSILSPRLHSLASIRPVRESHLARRGLVSFDDGLANKAAGLVKLI